MRIADILAEALLDWKVDVIFGLPGDDITSFIEALRLRQDKIKFVLVRHEESAAFMACAYAKYTGKLGACLAISGPGAIHLLNGLFDAKPYSDLMNSNYQQDVNLLLLYSDLSLQ
jgi:pyruvate dehydrogenase (quinone)